MLIPKYYLRYIFEVNFSCKKYFYRIQFLLFILLQFTTCKLSAEMNYFYHQKNNSVSNQEYNHFGNQAYYVTDIIQNKNQTGRNKRYYLQVNNEEYQKTHRINSYKPSHYQKNINKAHSYFPTIKHEMNIQTPELPMSMSRDNNASYNSLLYASDMELKQAIFKTNNNTNSTMRRHYYQPDSDVSVKYEIMPAYPVSKKHSVKSQNRYRFDDNQEHLYMFPGYLNPEIQNFNHYKFPNIKYR